LSDIGLSDVWHIGYAEMTFRLVLALALGGLIGFEREWGGHPAGFRTHILVCLGSAVVMLLSEYGFSQFAAEPNVQMDPARLAAQVISGIGFLGAGTILRTGFTISGLTTAASLWVVAAIGLAAGAGFYYGAVVSTVLAVISLFFLNKLEKIFSQAKKEREVIVRFRRGTPALSGVVALFAGSGVQISKLTVESDDEADIEVAHMLVKVKVKNAWRPEQLTAELLSVEGVVGAELPGGGA